MESLTSIIFSGIFLVGTALAENKIGKPMPSPTGKPITEILLDCKREGINKSLNFLFYGYGKIDTTMVYENGRTLPYAAIVHDSQKHTNTLFIDNNKNSKIDKEIDLNYLQPKKRNVCYYIPKDKETQSAKRK